MELLSSTINCTKQYFCIIDTYSKCAWVIPLKDKKGIKITSTFQKILNESGHKPNKIWVDQGSEFDNRLMKSWFHDNGSEMYSAHNGGISVVAENFIRIMETKIYKHMKSVSKMRTSIN